MALTFSVPVYQISPRFILITLLSLPVLYSAEKLPRRGYKRISLSGHHAAVITRNEFWNQVLHKAVGRKSAGSSGKEKAVSKDKK